MGYVVGNLPLGLSLPNNISAKAFPNSCPGNQVCKIAGQDFIHGMLTGDPVFITKTVFLFVAKIFLIRASCSPGRLKLFLSLPSVSQSELVPTTRITASDCFAIFTASSSKFFGSGGLQPN